MDVTDQRTKMTVIVGANTTAEFGDLRLRTIALDRGWLQQHTTHNNTLTATQSGKLVTIIARTKKRRQKSIAETRKRNM